MLLQFEHLKSQAMQLKYCERCGNIWLRSAGSPQTMCNPCAAAESAALDGPASFLQLFSRLRAEVQA
jgi:hypothetical protein